MAGVINSLSPGGTYMVLKNACISLYTQTPSKGFNDCPYSEGNRLFDEVMFHGSY